MSDDIVRDILAGLTLEEIADRHRKSIRTVSRYRGQVLGRQPRGRPKK